MGQKRLMPITLTLAADATTSPFLGENFDEAIRAWLETHDPEDEQDDAYLKWDSSQKILKIGAVVEGQLQTYVYDAQAKAFAPQENRNVGAFSMFRGVSYFGHRDNGKIYEDDLSRTNDGIAILHSWATGRIEHDRGRRHMMAYRFESEGFMTTGTEFNFRVYIDGSSTPSFDRMYTDTLITSSQGQALGERGVGLSAPGTGGTPTAFVFPFKLHIILCGLEGEDFKFEWEVTKEGVFLQANTFYFSAYVTRRSPRTYQ